MCKQEVQSRVLVRCAPISINQLIAYYLVQEDTYLSSTEQFCSLYYLPSSLLFPFPCFPLSQPRLAQPQAQATQKIKPPAYIIHHANDFHAYLKKIGWARKETSSSKDTHSLSPSPVSPQNDLVIYGCLE